MLVMLVHACRNMARRNLLEVIVVGVDFSAKTMYYYNMSTRESFVRAAIRFLHAVAGDHVTGVLV
jgi:hypothetical protein